MKTCPRCSENKNESEFNKDKQQKKSGLKVYCRTCEQKIYQEKKRKKETIEVENNITQIINLPPKIELKKNNDEKNLEKYKTSVEFLAKLISKQYGEDLIKADEVYDLFYNKIASGDNTMASKEALTKSLELRMSASDALIKLIQTANKIQESRDKSLKREINIRNVKDDFDLD